MDPCSGSATHPSPTVTLGMSFLLSGPQVPRFSPLGWLLLYLPLHVGGIQAWSGVFSSIYHTFSRWSLHIGMIPELPTPATTSPWGSRLVNLSTMHLKLTGSKWNSRSPLALKHLLPPVPIFPNSINATVSHLAAQADISVIPDSSGCLTSAGDLTTDPVSSAPTVPLPFGHLLLTPLPPACPQPPAALAWISAAASLPASWLPPSLQFCLQFSNQVII